MALTYTYELRKDSNVVSTGRLTTDRPVDVDDRITVAGVLAVIVDVVQLTDETRLVLEARRDPI